MTLHMEARQRSGIQNYLDSGNRDPVTVRALIGSDWISLSPRTRSTLGAWMLKEVCKDTFPEIQPVGRNAENSMTHSISNLLSESRRHTLSDNEYLSGKPRSYGLSLSPWNME